MGDLQLLLLLLVLFTFIGVKKQCKGELNSFDLPSYKTHVTILETFTNTTLRTLSSVCDINDRHIMECSSPGFHEVEWTSVIENETQTYWVPFDDTPYCYIWNTSYIYQESNDTFLITVWIITSSTSEASSHQTLPPNVLSNQFWLQGEYPRLSLDHTNITISLLGFNNNTWQYRLSQLTESVYSYTVSFETSISSLLDCTVRPVRVNIARPKYHLDSVITEVNSSLLITPNDTSTEYIQLFKDVIEPSVLILTRGITNVITQNGFQTYTVFQVNGFTGSIQEVVFTSGSVCILIGGEVITLTNRNSSVTWPSGLPTVISHITGRGRRQVYNNHDTVIAWSHMMTSLYVSVDGGRSFNNVTMTTDQDYIIRALRVHPVKDEVLVSVHVDNNTFSIHYNILTQLWTNTSQYYNYSNGSISMEYFPSLFGDLIIWGRQTLYYSTNGDNLLPINILQSNSSQGQQQPSSYQWNSNEYIITVTTGIWGQIAAVTSDGSLLYGRTSTGSVIKVPYYINLNTSTVYFNSLGDLKMTSINFENGGISINTITVPVYSLLLSSFYPPAGCPFLQWTHNINRLHFYHLDTNQTIQLWVSLTPRQWSPNNISVSVSNDSVIERMIVSSVENQTPVQGIIKRNMSISISSLNLSGHSVIKLAPVSNSLTCHEPAEEHIELLLSCPPNKHIRLVRDNPHTTCTDFNNHMYTVSRNYYDPDFRGRQYISASEDKVIVYNVTSWGCPISVPYNHNYKPVLALYNGNTFIEQLNADYVLREIHGRTDFNYNATAANVGCIRRPQTWEQMLNEEGGNQPWNVWTPQTYRGCFEGPPESFTTSIPYQIHNGTGYSSLQWQNHNGIYVFAATVIAKNYSFCNLTVLFSVQVYGATQTLSFLGYVLLVVTCLLSSLALALSFIFYRKYLYTNNLLLINNSNTTKETNEQL